MNYFRYIRSVHFFAKPTVFLCFLMLSLPSVADCEGLVAQIGAELKIADASMPENGGFSDCKILPADQSVSAIAFAGLKKSKKPDDLPDVYDLNLLLVRSEDAKVLVRLFRKNAFLSDAIALEGVWVDTARYQLTPQVRAIGLRANFASHSRSYITRIGTINLYAKRGPDFDEVLTNFINYDFSGTGAAEMDAAGDACTSTATEIKRTLSMAKTSSHGYSGILVTEKTIYTTDSFVNNECKTKSTQAIRRYVLTFNGNVYSVPKKLRYGI